jgi:dGTPase
MQLHVRQLKSFLMSNLYGHPVLNRVASLARSVTGKLFEFYYANPRCLPVEWQTRMSLALSPDEAVLVACDFVSGMTDRYALNEYRRYVVGSLAI